MVMKRFTCNSCGSKYMTKAKLNEHKKSHIYEPDEKVQLPCQSCDKKFSSVGFLNRHQKLCSGQAKEVSPKGNDSQCHHAKTDDGDQNFVKDMDIKVGNDPPIIHSSSLNTSEVASASQRTSQDNHVNGDLLIQNDLSSTNDKPSNAKSSAVAKSVRSKITTRSKSRSSITAKDPVPINNIRSAFKKLKSSFKRKGPLKSKSAEKQADEDMATVSSSSSDSKKQNQKGPASHKIKQKADVESLITAQKKMLQGDVSNILIDTEKDVSDKMNIEGSVSDDTDTGEVTDDNDENFPDPVKSKSDKVATAVKKKFTCTKCHKNFSRKYHLTRHMRLPPCSGQPAMSFICHLCTRSYSRKDNLREHLRRHTGEHQRPKNHKCSYCSKCFHGQSLLVIHERKHTGERPYECDRCDKTFVSAGALSKHVRTHTGEKPFQCKVCQQKFALNGTLKRHMRVHTGLRPHKCKFCDKQFIQIGGLRAHLFYHTGENGFKCEKCDKTFNRKARLQMHDLYVHQKHRPFTCGHCTKAFTRKEDLSRHSVLHTGEKPFKCSSCSKAFSIKSSLKLHLLTHTKEEPRSCHECGRAFIRKDCLIRHMRKRHKDVLDKILTNERDEKYGDSMVGSRTIGEEELCENITELLSLLVEETTLVRFGWPNKPVDEVLEMVIRRCGHTPVGGDQYSFVDRMRENAKLLFTVVIDDNAVKTLLNNQTVDEVILHVLRLAKT